MAFQQSVTLKDCNFTYHISPAIKNIHSVITPLNKPKQATISLHVFWKKFQIQTKDSS